MNVFRIFLCKFAHNEYLFHFFTFLSVVTCKICKFTWRVIITLIYGEYNALYECQVQISWISSIIVDIIVRANRKIAHFEYFLATFIVSLCFNKKFTTFGPLFIYWNCLTKIILKDITFSTFTTFLYRN